MTIGGVSARSRWMRSTNASLPFRKCSIHTEVSMSTLIAGPMLPPLHGDAGHPESEALRCRARQGACLLAHARRFCQLIGVSVSRFCLEDLANNIIEWSLFFVVIRFVNRHRLFGHT